MREDGLVGKPRRRYRQTTDSRHANRIWPDRVRQNFTVQQPNRVWVSDITYIPTRSKWLYLCVVLDLYSRKVIGWSMQTSLSSELAIQAVRMAWRHRAPKTKPIFHSDRGIQYASSQFQHQLQRLGLQPSMSPKGVCYDNAVAEAFMRNLKVEAVYGNNFETTDQAKAAIFEYIEVYYNRIRRHSTLKYLSPEEFEKNTVA